MSLSPSRGKRETVRQTASLRHAFRMDRLLEELGVRQTGPRRPRP